MATRTRTRRSENPPPVRTAAVGLLVVLGIAVFGWQALRVYNGVPLRNYSTVYVSTPEVGNLLDHDPVRIAGARVGQVIGRDVGADGEPRLKLQIEPGTTLPSDTKVAVRGAGLLGARYVELLPGESTTNLAEGATIHGTDASYTYGVSEALDTFDAQTRGALGDLVGGLGQGLLGHGEALNDSIAAAGTQSKPFGEFAAAILRRQGAAGRLVPALESAVRPLDANRARLTDAMAAAADAVEPFVAQRAAMRAGLDAAPPALVAVQSGLGAGTHLLGAVRAAATEATRTLPKAPSALRATTALLRAGRVPLQRAQALLRAAQTAVPGALRITSALRPVLGPLQGMLGSLDPILTQVGRYGCDLVNFGTVFRSMTGYTQPGEGPAGPSQAFRLQIVAPVSGEVLGLKNTAAGNTREGIVAPCKYLAKPYPQFVGGAAR